jgi:hypothetical protein
MPYNREIDACIIKIVAAWENPTRYEDLVL